MQPVQMKMARAALDMSIDQLAEIAGLSHVDVARLESGEGGDAGLLGRLRAVFEEHGIELIEEDAVRARTTPSAEVIPLEQLNSANDE